MSVGFEPMGTTRSTCSVSVLMNRSDALALAGGRSLEGVDVRPGIVGDHAGDVQGHDVRDHRHYERQAFRGKGQAVGVGARGQVR